MILSVLLPDGRAWGEEGGKKGAEGETLKLVFRPHPGHGPLALGPEGYYWGVAVDSEEMPSYLYKIKANGSDWQIIHTFRPKGSSLEEIGPQGAVVFDGVDSMLGSTSGSVKSGGHGTLYKVNVKTGALTTLLKFTGTQGPHLGSQPCARLVADGMGFFWGSTRGGGKNDNGTIFKYHLATGVLTTVVELPKATDSNPQILISAEALTSVGKGEWWGMSKWGGKEDQGALFKVKADTGELTTMVEFTMAHGGQGPHGSLVSDGRGFLWGVCVSGGQGHGAVFKVDATTGALTTVVEFTGAGGRNPGHSSMATLVNDGQGFLWGSTLRGGSGDGGTLFKVDITSGALTTLVEFQMNQSRQKGYWPYGTLVDDGHGAFLGATRSGGELPGGTVFKVDVKTGVLTTLVEFGKVGP